MDTFRRLTNVSVGVGGWKCRCCGPKPEDKAQYRRMGGARMKADLIREVDEYEKYMADLERDEYEMSELEMYDNEDYYCLFYGENFEENN